MKYYIVTGIIKYKRDSERVVHDWIDGDQTIRASWAGDLPDNPAILEAGLVVVATSHSLKEPNAVIITSISEVPFSYISGIPSAGPFDVPITLEDLLPRLKSINKIWGITIGLTTDGNSFDVIRKFPKEHINLEADIKAFISVQEYESYPPMFWVTDDEGYMIGNINLTEALISRNITEFGDHRIQESPYIGKGLSGWWRWREDDSFGIIFGPASDYGILNDDNTELPIYMGQKIKLQDPVIGVMTQKESRIIKHPNNDIDLGQEYEDSLDKIPREKEDEESGLMEAYEKKYGKIEPKQNPIAGKPWAGNSMLETFPGYKNISDENRSQLLSKITENLTEQARVLDRQPAQIIVDEQDNNIYVKQIEGVDVEDSQKIEEEVMNNRAQQQIAERQVSEFAARKINKEKSPYDDFDLNTFSDKRDRGREEID